MDNPNGPQGRFVKGIPISMTRMEWGRISWISANNWAPSVPNMPHVRIQPHQNSNDPSTPALEWRSRQSAHRKSLRKERSIRRSPSRILFPLFFLRLFLLSISSLRDTREPQLNRPATTAGLRPAATRTITGSLTPTCLEKFNSPCNTGQVISCPLGARRMPFFGMDILLGEHPDGDILDSQADDADMLFLHLNIP